MTTDKLSYSGVTSSYLHKHKPDEPNGPDTQQGIRQVWFLDAQWSTCPIEVEDQVKDLWSLYELGNDNYIIKTSVNHLLELGDRTVEKRINGSWATAPLKVDYVVQYIREHGVPDDAEVIIHWWW